MNKIKTVVLLIVAIAVITIDKTLKLCYNSFRVKERKVKKL